MMRQGSSFFLLILMAGTVFSWAQDDPLVTPVGAFLETHCIDCHDSDVKKGGFDIDELSAAMDSPESIHRWERMFDRVAAGEMPPAKKEQPT
ncbi:MAG: c-type cytochrome domain-containing protein, partial [Verrucomicrobiota bacterium]